MQRLQVVRTHACMFACMHAFEWKMCVCVCPLSGSFVFARLDARAGEGGQRASKSGADCLGQGATCSHVALAAESCRPKSRREALVRSDSSGALPRSWVTPCETLPAWLGAATWSCSLSSTPINQHADPTTTTFLHTMGAALTSRLQACLLEFALR